MNIELTQIYNNLKKSWRIIQQETSWWFTEKVLNTYWTYSNLNMYCSLFTRSKAFLDWFGDWENNMNESSKVVDEFWEPKLVWHWTNKKFDTFDDNEEWIYFCDFDIANRYAKNKFDNTWWFIDNIHWICMYWWFLSIKNPLYTNKIKYRDIDKETNRKKKDTDGVIMYNTRDALWTYDQYLVKNTESIMIVYK